MRSGRAGEGNVQAPGLALGQQLHAALQRVKVVQQSGCIGLQGAPGLGQRHAFGVAFEQWQAYLGLQALDLLAQRGLGHAQRFGRTGHVAGLRHGQEVPQLAQIHQRGSWLARQQ